MTNQRLVMPPAIIETVKNKLPLEKLLKWQQFAVGLAEDFWKDGTENPFRKITEERHVSQALHAMHIHMPAAHAAAAGSKPSSKRAAALQTEAPSTKEWHAQPGEISEKMWGTGFVAPGTETVAESLIAPLGLTKDMNVLDLSAGLGGRMRGTSEKYGVYITGLEPDPQIAARGMAMSIVAGKGKHDIIQHYDPNNFTSNKHYDCIIARETLYRVTDKAKFIAAIAACSKPKAQIAFTDYIVNPEDREKPAILKWQAFENGANPVSLIEMAELWAKVGFNLRVHEDQSAFYRKEVLMGLKQLAVFMATGVKPDAETKKALLRRIETWVHRVAAMEQGMKFFRFYGARD